MAKDPYRYFRVEARELLEGLSQGVLQLERGPLTQDLVARLLRLAHTLKGASRVVKQPAIGDLAHAAEDVLVGFRGAIEPVSHAETTELLSLLDDIASRVRDLGSAASEVTPLDGAAVDDSLATLRVDVREMEALARGVTEAGVQLGALRRGIASVGRLRDLANGLLAHLEAPSGTAPAVASLRARASAEELRAEAERLCRGLAADLDRVAAEIAGAQEVAHQLRLVPARTLFPSLERAVRDAAQTLGKRVELSTAGGEVRLDAHVLAALRDALLHVARNAVAHGIEADAERRAAGKVPTGHVKLEIVRRGTRVTFACTDDGRGVDVEAVRRAAVSRGSVGAVEAAALTDQEVMRLLLLGGLTTSGAVDEISGRGVGLDVVREVVARLKGEVAIHSDAGRGTRVDVHVPISVSSLPALIVESGGVIAAMPLDAICETRRLHEAALVRGARGDSILVDGRLVPFVPLECALHQAARNGPRHRTWSAMVLDTPDGLAAVGADRFLGTATIVLRPLPDVVHADPLVAGVSLDSDGNPQIVLDPRGLVALALGGLSPGPAPSTAVRPPILVVDDSMTTRMLEQSILESAGYEVDLAVSAEEALLLARDKAYGLFVVDVEMPGIDGFEFVARTRADPAFQDVPAILVTSRNAPEDRRRGAQVGARGYIAKGEFDQADLLRTIRALIG